MSYKLISFFSLLCLFFSCVKQRQAQSPIEYTRDEFVQMSKVRSKKLYEIHTKEIVEYIKKNNLIKFQATAAGFWVGFPNNNFNYTDTKDVENIKITYAYEVTDLDDNVIYSFEEIGIKKIILGKENIIRGLQYALETIPKKQESLLILPSFLAYGNYGDSKKIGNDKPLVIRLKILEKQKP